MFLIGYRRGLRHRPATLAALTAMVLAASAAAPASAARTPPRPASTAAAAAANSCSGDNLSPTSRTLVPKSVYSTAGSVGNATGVLSGQATRLSGNGSAVTLDFGKEVGGIVTLTFAGSSDASQSVGLAFTESSQSVGNSSDNSAGGTDGAIFASVQGAGSYTMPGDKLRGGFRYLTLFLNSGGWADVSGVSLAFSAAPGVSGAMIRTCGWVPAR